MLLNETILAKPIVEEISRDKLPDGVLCRVSYPICIIGERNANNRVYETAVWDKVMAEKELMDKIKNRALFGHAEHPDQTQSNLEKTSHVIIEMWMDDGQVWQKFDVLDTPTGRIVDCLLKSCQVGCSTRAEGDLEEAEDDTGTYQRVIPENYNFVTTDFTADPSTFGVIPYDIKRNVLSSVKKELESKKLNGSERQFAQLIFEAMKCQDGKCVVEKVVEIVKKSKKKTVEGLIKEGTIKVDDKVKYGDKSAKVSKIEEGVVSLLVGTESPTAVSVNGDAAVSISPEGLITILPTETLSELGQKEPKETEPETEDIPAPETTSAEITGDEELEAEEEVPEGGDTRGQRDGTGPPDGGMGIRKMRGEECPFESIKVGATVKIEEGEHKDKEGKITKIEETGITIALDDGTTVSIEDPTAVGIAVTKPVPEEEIEPVSPPEEEVEDMEADKSLPIEKDVPEEEFESKTSEVKLPTESGVGDELDSGNLLQDKDGKDWTVKKVGDGGLTVTQPGELGTEKFISWEDVGSYGFTKVSESNVDESKVEEATVVQKDDGWYVESPDGKILGGPYDSKIEADKRRKDVEFYVASRESKVNEEDKESFENWFESNSRALRYDYMSYDEQCKADDSYPEDFRDWAREYFEEEDVEESKVTETADIKAMYKAAKLPAPDGKGVHTKAFHELVINVAKGYVKSGDTPKKALDKAYPTAMKQLGKEKAVKKPHQKESISTTAKEIKNLIVKEASIRAERDKAIELLEEITDDSQQLKEKVKKEKVLEVKILVNRIGKILRIKEQEVDALRFKLEEKAQLAADLKGQLGEKSKLAVKAQEMLDEIKTSLSNDIKNLNESISAVEDEHQKEAKLSTDHLLEVEEKHGKEMDKLVESSNKKIEKVREELETVTKKITKKFVKNFVELKLSESVLKIDDNSRALLEGCKSLEEVENLLEDIMDASRRGALHSKLVRGIRISKPEVMDPEEREADRRVGDVFKGFGY